MADFVNPVKEKLARGEAAFGTMLTMPSPHMAQFVSAAGLDWAMFDMEHGPIDLPSAHAMINATMVSDTVPIVRAPSTDPKRVKPILDAGALGVFFPVVNTPEQAREGVSACTYPMGGERGFGPFYAASRWGKTLLEYAHQADAAILKVMMIEHIDAVRRIDEILEVEGIDVAFIAPFDLSQSLGRAGDFEAPEFKQAMATAEAAVAASSAVMGGLGRDVDGSKAMLDRGYRFIMLGFDGMIVERAYRGMLEALRP